MLPDLFRLADAVDQMVDRYQWAHSDWLTAAIFSSDQPEVERLWRAQRRRRHALRRLIAALRDRQGVSSDG
ncbi:hypothetical protein JQS43_21870 [Natronosporangium hydrolyticum]|uniref:Uncharacterized protein n=1 Tax=Natronosporangium hydrolyticum TaxID=2811111 RepID=A0A895Y8S4_9ACTN|nr:hypothetical protein [Natronosporangium hydrolyticum]QSB14144.1 hypothetical protein JQS43_21870 [Natronosporangium hydrolyticum]